VCFFNSQPRRPLLDWGGPSRLTGQKDFEAALLKRLRADAVLAAARAVRVHETGSTENDEMRNAAAKTERLGGMATR